MIVYSVLASGPTGLSVKWRGAMTLWLRTCRVRHVMRSSNRTLRCELTIALTERGNGAKYLFNELLREGSRQDVMRRAGYKETAYADGTYCNTCERTLLKLPPGARNE